jgi:hypothetical protein
MLYLLKNIQFFFANIFFLVSKYVFNNKSSQKIRSYIIIKLPHRTPPFGPYRPYKILYLTKDMANI